MSEDYVNEEAVLDEDTEDAVMRIMTNEPSEPIEVGTFVVVFQRPSMVNKFRQRAWTKRKLKLFGMNPNEDSDEVFLFQQWGTLNSYVTNLYVPDKKGKVKVNGKTYSEYIYNPDEDLDYGSVFEKFINEEIYNRGRNEEAVVVQTFNHFIEWVNEAMVPEGDDIKNS